MGRALGEAWGHLSHVPLRAEASDRAECVNELLAGETVTELEVGRGDWVKVRLPDGYEGWMDRRQLKPVTGMWQGKPMRLANMTSAWRGVSGGLLPAGAVVREHQGEWHLGEQRIEPMNAPPTVHEGSMWAWAEQMLGVPYHWGGRCGWGFDCSGLTSLAAALVGISVPRDASMQFGLGLEVDLGHDEPDDVVFFSNDKGQITHVGISNGHGRVIHASGEVRIDVLKGDGLHRHEDDVKSHYVAGIRRWTRALS